MVGVGHFRRSFLTGLLIVLPAVVTVWLFALLLGPVRRFATPPVVALLRVVGLDTYLDVPGAGVGTSVLGLLLTLVFIYLVGLLGSNIIGRSVVRRMDNLALSIPLVKSVYGSARQLMQTFYSGQGTTFESVVLIEYPRKGVFTVGLVTSRPSGELQDHATGELVNVFVPTTPNPTSGILVLARRDELTWLEMGVEEALRFVVSAGIVAPERRVED